MCFAGFSRVLALVVPSLAGLLHALDAIVSLVAEQPSHLVKEWLNLDWYVDVGGEIY